MKVVHIFGILLFSSTLSLIVGCAGQDSSRNEESAAAPQPEGNAGLLNEVIKARVSILVAPGGEDQVVANLAEMFSAVNVSEKLPIDIINAPNTTIEFDTSKFKIPAISNALLSFGTIELATLTDNVLSVCGTNKKTKCTKAFIRFYTTGVKGAGVWNADGGYGMPIYASVIGGKSTTVGLNPENSGYMASISIPSSKHVLTRDDFSATTHYNLSSDFKTAGAGIYSTTLIIEYGLAD
jgi:hypothetical protein